jgi:soluble lytic murein transglycosylase-like protein
MPVAPELIALARSAAARHSLDPALVCAVVEQESAWDTHAIRYESAFRVRYVAPLGLPPTEEVARSISWGLMQVMGHVAREHGFSAKFLSALCDPATGLDIGCAVLASKLIAASKAPSAGEGEIPSPAPSAAEVGPGLERWNGGANPTYAAEVLARVAKYK